MTKRLPADVAILGSGFGGSLMALLLHRIGLRPVLIDRGRHPRFAIGESSTPVADLVLADLTEKYDLPRLRPLAKYGTWQATYPELRCGIKRGFSYFHQRPNERFVPRENHANELLVAASVDDRRADTHWHRADVDGFFAQEVHRNGIPFFEGMEVTLAAQGDDWELSGRTDAGSIRITAKFVIDASGDAGAVLRALGVPRDRGRCLTRSRAIFAHFENVRPWREVFTIDERREHPFPCDQAALHQVIDEGWMWQLRFDGGIVSAGFAIDEGEHPIDDRVPVEREWDVLIERYPSLADQFAQATIAAPVVGLRRTGRMQRVAAQMAGRNWALLPSAAGFIDPLHSTGIAQTLCGIERLATVFEESWRRPTLSDRLKDYERTLRREFSLIDRIVAGGYASRRSFPLFVAYSMLYFAAATTYERRRQNRELAPGAALLCADDPAMRRVVSSAWTSLRRMLAAGPPDDATVEAFGRDLANAVAPFNKVGLFDPAANNMYRYTVLPG